MSEFSYSLILVSASAPKIPYRSGPIYDYLKVNFENTYSSKKTFWAWPEWNIEFCCMLFGKFNKSITGTVFLFHRLASLHRACLKASLSSSWHVLNLNQSVSLISDPWLRTQAKSCEQLWPSSIPLSMSLSPGTWLDESNMGRFSCISTLANV